MQMNSYSTSCPTNSQDSDILQSILMNKKNTGTNHQMILFNILILQKKKV